jgi:hypothetical protein
MCNQGTSVFLMNKVETQNYVKFYVSNPWSVSHHNYSEDHKPPRSRVSPTFMYRAVIINAELSKNKVQPLVFILFN